MTPCLLALGETPSLMAQMGMDALNDALSEAGLKADELDGIIVACSGIQRWRLKFGILSA